VRLALVLMASAVLASCQKAPQNAPTQELAVLTGLPLFWDEGAAANAVPVADERAPIIQRLAETYRIKALDSLSPDILKSVPLLLLAQPKGLAPAELLALDNWVRAGGKLLIFADPLLSAPSILPLGDPRRAPVVTLLDPLLLHWRVALASPSADLLSPHIVQLAGAKTVVQSEGHWTQASNACAILDAGVRIECAVGKGFVILIADADLLNLELGGSVNIANEIAVQNLLTRLENRTEKEQIDAKQQRADE
jgi:hypothetical protein